MKTEVRITKSFKKAVKPLLKKYASLIGELATLESTLIENPRLGTALGENSYKIRLKSKASKKVKVAVQELLLILKPKLWVLFGKPMKLQPFIC